MVIERNRRGIGNGEIERKRILLDINKYEKE